MWARISKFEGSPADIDASMEDVRATVLPACQRLDGFLGMMVLVDRATGASNAITFWQDEEALRASERAASTIREEGAQRQGERIVGVERFEVPLSTIAVDGRA